MAGARVSQCGGELAGRLGGDVHRESFGFVAESCSLPGLDQRDREPAQRSSSADTKDLPLARRQDGAPLGRRGTAHDRTEFSKDYGLPRPLDAEGSLGGKSNCVEEAGGVKSFQPPLTSHDERDTFQYSLGFCTPPFSPVDGARTDWCVLSDRESCFRALQH